MNIPLEEVNIILKDDDDTINPDECPTALLCENCKVLIPLYEEDALEIYQKHQSCHLFLCYKNTRNDWVVYSEVSGLVQ